MRLCLIGQHIAHSPSPAMQQAALDYYNVPGSYSLRPTRPDELDSIVQRIRDGEIDGCNVTEPYKGEMARRCDVLVGDAVALGAVNTVMLEGDKVTGDNTDALGFEMGLSVHRLWPRENCHAVILGAGGAAAACALALSRVPAQEIVIAARREEAATALAERLAFLGNVHAVRWDRAVLRKPLSTATIVVNGTPAGLDYLPFHPRDLPARCTVADVRYAPRPVDTVTAAEAAHRRGCDGAEMLLYQGMLSFHRWTQLDPPWSVAREVLYETLDRPQ